MLHMKFRGSWRCACYTCASTFRAAMIKIARTVCLEACCHQRQVLAQRRPFRAISRRASRPAPICSSIKHTKICRGTGKAFVLKTGIRSRGFACSAAVMEKQSTSGNPLLAVWALHPHQNIILNCRVQTHQSRSSKLRSDKAKAQ
jgi:hypothetical protein